MTNTKTVLALAIGLAASAVVSHAAIDIGTLGPVIQFNKNGVGLNQFGFKGAGIQWMVGTTTGVVGDSYGLAGTFGNTTYSFNANGDVTGLGNLKIWDGGGMSGSTLTGDITWGIGSLFVDNSGVASLNKTLTLNVNNVIYGGGNSDLAQLAAAGKITLNLTFQRASGALTIGTLLNDKLDFTASASLSAVPEPSTYVAGLGALCLFAFTAIPKRKTA